MTIPSTPAATSRSAASGAFGGHDDHSQPDPLLADDARQVFERLHADALDDLADFRGVGVEGGGDREVLPAEAAVAEERLPEVADADHRHVPGVVGAEDVPHRPDELVAAVADAWIAELPEEPQILADLGVAEPEKRPQLARRDGLLAGGDEPLEFAEVEAQAAHHHLGHGCVRGQFRRVRRLGSLIRHGKACR